MALPKVGRFNVSVKGLFSVQLGLNGTEQKSKPAIPLTSITISPRDFGIADNTPTKLYVDVILGPTVAAQDSFEYENESAMVAHYVVDGVSFDPKLEFSHLSIPDWFNWARSVRYKVPDRSYFFPHTRADLRDVIHRARDCGAHVRVSGQRHSQGPLALPNNRTETVPAVPDTFIVDMSCYADLGPSSDQSLVMASDNNSVTVNAGVREDELNVFVTNHNKILPTVTAGGFFSTGGMTCVDVHGCTIKEPIFAETVLAYNVMGSDGNVLTIDASTPQISGVRPLDCARVNFGMLGVVTSVTIQLYERPYANSLLPSKEWTEFSDGNSFIAMMQDLLKNERLEVFVNPYEFKALSLIWNMVTPTVTIPNAMEDVETACAHADDDEFGAPLLGKFAEPAAEALARSVQQSHSTSLACGMVAIAMETIQKDFVTAVQKYSDLWLTTASRTMFMSYFVKLPDLGEAGLHVVWKGVKVVIDRLKETEDFLLVIPVEFRFIKGGKSLLSSTYDDATDDKTATFVNFDLISFVPDSAPEEYSQDLLDFYAHVEKAWCDMGGTPHNGKMFGFFNPNNPKEQCKGAFNEEYMSEYSKKRRQRLDQFEKVRNSRDPNGLFMNEYTSKLLGVSLTGS